MTMIQLVMFVILIGSATTGEFGIESWSWMDPSLPEPLFVHQLGQRARRRRRHLEEGEEQPPQPEQPQPDITAKGQEILPLFPGYGTHYAYVYVGTPPQRQSVIIDTGSHYTAFPCTGCSQCGQHTDAYWDLKNSSSASVPTCINNQPCVISQSYTEGSSWKAFQVNDKLWVGGSALKLPIGLFRTQLADGIMGMAMNDDTLPYQLQKQGVTKTKIFALCFRIGGGIFTIGGVDQRLHLGGVRKALSYAKSFNAGGSGWFGVNIVDIKFVLQQGQRAANKQDILLGEDKTKFSSGRGAIVDSGTTDTYLPQTIAKKFAEAFAKASDGSSNGEVVEVSMPWTNYVDSVGDGIYSFRIYLTETSGTVSNVMTGYNIVFDPDGKRLGFAKSECNYEEFNAEGNADDNGDDNMNTPDDCSQKVAATECTAFCEQNTTAYISSGTLKPDPATKTAPTTRLFAEIPSVQDGDYLIYIDMRIQLDSTRWSYVSTEAFYEAMALMFKLRLKARDFTGVSQLHAEAERITDITVSKKFDGDRIVRFGWMRRADIVVISAAIPLGDIRDTYGETSGYNGDKSPTASSGWSQLDFLLLGIALGSLLVMATVLYLYRKLQQELQLSSKDKGSMRSLWQRFMVGSSNTGPGASSNTVFREEQERELEMSSSALLADDEA
eukprot:gene29752-38893_t